MSANAATIEDLAIEDCTFRVLVEGDAAKPTLVLSHMLGLDMSMWDDLAGELLEHFRVVRYDSRGHGGSGLGHAPVTIDRLGRDVVAILDALGIARAHFCGLSMGGVVGQWLLVHAPTRIDRAIIADTAAKLGEPAGWNARIAAALTQGMDQAVEPTIDRWFSPGFVRDASDKVDAIRRRLRATSPEGYAACCAALRDTDLREALRAVVHPVLVLRGTGDPTVSAEDATLLVEAMDHATSVELAARHCSAVEAGAEFAAAVVKFLAAKAAPRRALARRAGKSAEQRAERTNASMRRRGGRDVDAARRPVAKTAPVSGKAVAKASASRKSAARAVPRTLEPVASRRRATKTRAAARSAAASTQAGETRPAQRATSPSSTARMMRTAKAAPAKTSRTSTKGGSPRREPASGRTPPSSPRAKPTAAALKAAAKASGGNRGGARPSGVATKRQSSKAASADLPPSNVRSARPSSARPSSAKPAAVKSSTGKSVSAKLVSAKPVSAKPVAAKPASAKPAASNSPKAKGTKAKTSRSTAGSRGSKGRRGRS